MNSSGERRTDLVPIILIIIGVLLVIGVVVWQIALQPGQNSTQANNNQAIPEPGIQRVSLSDAKAAFDNKTALFVDVRDPQSYQTSHVPGAVNIPLAEMESRFKELDPGQWIILYCT